MPQTAFASTYASHRRGIATFTFDLASAVGGREIVALHPADGPRPYPPEVHHRIRRDSTGLASFSAHDGCVVPVERTRSTASNEPRVRL